MVKEYKTLLLQANQLEGTFNVLSWSENWELIHILHHQRSPEYGEVLYQRIFEREKQNGSNN